MSKLSFDIELSLQSPAQGDAQGFRTAANRIDCGRQLVKLYAAAAQFERGQREQLDLTCSYARARGERRPRVVSATCRSTATSLPAACAPQAP